MLPPGEGQPPGAAPVAAASGILGVTGEPSQDAWVSFGLYQFRHTEQWLEVPRLIQWLPEMELVWGQPDEEWAGFDFETGYQTGPPATRSDAERSLGTRESESGAWREPAQSGGSSRVCQRRVGYALRSASGWVRRRIKGSRCPQRLM